jgi:cell cycle checkpoint control protein RAD9A
MYAKALLSVFKGRLYDVSGRDGAIDRCEVSVQERPDQTQCRFIVKMVCNHGVIKTYRLTYESVDVMHALFDRNMAKNRWSIHSSTIRDYIVYFDPKTELLDIFSGEDGRMVMKSYTEKISAGKEVLKNPLVTAVAIDTSDFEQFEVDTGLHIIISVKDFKAVVTHADTLKTNITAYYSQPARPLQFSYGCDGLLCEFTLMTSGDYKASKAPAANIQSISNRKASRAESASTDRRGIAGTRSDMPPPVEPAYRRPTGRRIPGSRKESTQKPPESHEDSIFVRQEEEDSRWEPLDANQEEETLGWDASGEHGTALYPTFQDSASMSRTETEDSNDAVAPTQRISQIKGLW